jgi:hypothetical protein
MSETILTSLFTLAGVVIGGGFSLWATVIMRKNQQKTKEVQGVLKQWQTFYEIEKDLVRQIVELDNSKNEHAVRNETRSVIYSREYETLDTPGKIKTMIKTWR